jgi:CRP/FNR family transcriptional regulator, cyclic AMP receptor protein
MTDIDPTAASPLAKPRPLMDNAASAARAVELLLTPHSVVEFTAADARCVVALMGLVNIARGQVIYREGDTDATDQMLLLLSGEVSVEMADLGRPDAVTVAVLGAGNLLGEMGMLDGAPRSATCRAVSDVVAATFTRDSLKRLIDEQPQVAARLLIAMSQRQSDRLRAMGEQLKLYAHPVGQSQVLTRAGLRQSAQEQPLTRARRAAP